MQEVKDLIPHLNRLKELYQQEDFKPLEQFLHSCKDDLQGQLYSVDFTDSKSAIKAATLTSQINLLGMILSLPKAVQLLRDQFEQQEQRMKDFNASQVDPLNQEGVG